MKVTAVAIFLVVWASIAIAHPITSRVLPKEYYQRQNLPDIPGYIPVYIKHDEEPYPKAKENLHPKTEDKGNESHLLHKQEALAEKAAAQQHKSLPEQNKTSKIKELTDNFKLKYKIKP